jgi:hypothetical protein
VEKSKLLRVSYFQEDEKTMKKYLIPLCMVLMVLSSALVLAEDTTNDVPEDVEVVEVVVEDQENQPRHPTPRIGPNVLIQVLDHFMEKYDLDEDASIADLIDALQEDRDDHQEALMEEYGVETEEELREALRAEHVDELREMLGLDDSYSDEEVLDIAREERLAEVLDALGLDEDATPEEIQEAMQEWREENSALLLSPGGPGHNRGPFGFFRGWFN